MIIWFRRLLVRLGKVLPFVICVIVCINYAESAFSVATSDFLVYDGVVIPNTRISFLIGRYFEYNFQTLFVLVVISVSIQTCIYNKIACVYLGINLLEKSYFDYEMYPEQIIAICTINIVVGSFLTYKGLKMVT